ncbi:type III secretion system chaperone [Thalassomonas viridans]|uniref:Type III secretion system chaperone n=1 Tax=Thalassomonas viridans TaxID=137584 RepID=A0AAE9Z9Q2_9GAMM|nr:CesT family type III secretion system chaperone [Thalassomonas viridans]WDE08857.1 type III secretion system chaperone [Thalassomonas viridans]
MQINNTQLAVLKQFARQLGYQDSDIVDGKGFALAIDDKVQINILNQEERCHLIAYLGQVDESNRLEFYEVLLQANHNQDELGGASLGICPNKKMVALSMALDSEGLDVSQLQKAFDQLLDKSLFWHRLLQDYEAEALPDENMLLSQSQHAVLA